MRKAASFVLAFLLLAGCGPQAPNHETRIDPQAPAPGDPAEVETGIDNRASDPAILEKDKLLHMGDAGIETKIPGYSPQQGATKEQPKAGASIQHHTGKDWWYIHEVNPNYGIKPTNGSYANNVLAMASLFFGTPYEYGSKRYDTKTFDCSDFVHYSHLAALGMDLPRDSRSQRKYVEKFGKRRYTNLSQAQPGDLLFFMSYKGWRPGDYKGIDPRQQTTTHVGIYMGNGKMIHTASKATGGVRIDNVFGKHYEYRFQGGGSVY